jgi:hypothetical protein
MGEGKVNNGRRVQVELPDFVGLAGYQDCIVGSDFLSYVPNLGGARVGAGETIMVEGVEREVTKRQLGTYVPGMVTLTLRALEETSE